MLLWRKRPADGGECFAAFALGLPYHYVRLLTQPQTHDAPICRVGMALRQSAPHQLIRELRHRRLRDLHLFANIFHRRIPHLVQRHQKAELRERQRIELCIDQVAAFQLIGALQLAWRHPRLSERIKDTIWKFGHQLSAAFDADDVPEVARTLEQGWQREFDRD